MKTETPITIVSSVRRENSCVPRLLLAISLLASALLVSVSVCADTSAFQSAESLRLTAQVFLQQQTALQREQESEISVGHLDRRLQLTECTIPPTAFLSPGSKLQGKLSVGLRCAGEKPWTVYIPAHINSFATVVTAARPLPRGTQLTEADLMTVRQDISRLRGGYFTKGKNLVGKIVKRPISTGQAFTVTNVQPPLLVRRGEEVVILASVGGLQVRVKGKALDDATLGERVPVRNNQSQRIVQGTAVESGIVSVQM